MLTLDTLNVMLAVSEEGIIEEIILTLLASRSWLSSSRNSPIKESHFRRSSPLARSAALPS